MKNNKFLIVVGTISVIIIAGIFLRYSIPQETAEAITLKGYIDSAGRRGYQQIITVHIGEDSYPGFYYYVGSQNKPLDLNDPNVIALVTANNKSIPESVYDREVTISGKKIKGKICEFPKVPESEGKEYCFKKQIIVVEKIVGQKDSNPLFNAPPPSPTPPVSNPALKTKPPQTPPVIPKANEQGATAAGIKKVVSGNNQFALDVYSKFKKDSGNIFFSPYSISTALAMTYEGARGKTAQEIQKVFHFPQDNKTRRSAFAAIYNQLNEPNTKHKLSIANALWAQNNYKILDGYIDVLRQYYAGKAANLDFINATEKARKTINTWVEEKTNYKIKDLFPKGSLNPLTRLVLTNAIYFKGQWVKQFDKKKTKSENFRVNSATTVKVPMMRQIGKNVKFKYSETEDLQILEMPYEGKKLSMFVLLPKNYNLTLLENSLSLEKLSSWEENLKEQRVDVFMPKFTFNTKYFLNKTLQEMGMLAAFSEGSADFSRIDGARRLFIQIVVHQAFVDVNEEGTEAAAATGVGSSITSLSPPVPVFRADHPFLFLIQDIQNGNILFLGRVANPKT